MSKTLVSMLAGLLILGAMGVVQAGAPDANQSFVALMPEPGMTTCPSGDGPSYEYITVTARTWDGTPVEGIPYTAFSFIVTGGPVTITHVDAETNANGEIRFSMVGDATIIGTITIQCQIYTVALTDIDTLACKSFDINGNGVVDLTDFIMFASDYGSTAYRSDFDWDGDVDLTDFILFASHYGD